MNIEEATRLERHILRVAQNWRPQAEQIGNGEWIVKLKCHREQIVWSIEDWNTTFVAQPSRKIVEEVSV